MEYAVITAGFLVMLAALCLLKDVAGGGTLIVHALASASHHVQGALGWAADIFSV